MSRNDERLARAARMFAALGDPTRLALLERLAREGPASITTLAGRFDVTRQGISKHLRVMAAAGVFEGRRQGREHVWAIRPDRLTEARTQLERMAQSWDSALSRLEIHVGRKGAEAAPEPTADDQWHESGNPVVSAYISRSSPWSE